MNSYGQECTVCQTTFRKKDAQNRNNHKKKAGALAPASLSEFARERYRWKK
jgi:hypothetical protein